MNITINEYNISSYVKDNSQDWDLLTSNGYLIKDFNILLNSTDSIRGIKFFKIFFNKVKYLKILKFYLHCEFNINTKISGFVCIKHEYLSVLNIEANVSKSVENQEYYIWKAVGFMKNLKKLKVVFKVEEKYKKLFCIKKKDKIDEFYVDLSNKDKIIQYLFCKLSANKVKYSLPYRRIIRNRIKNERKALFSKLLKCDESYFNERIQYFQQVYQLTKKETDYLNYLKLISTK